MAFFRMSLRHNKGKTIGAVRPFSSDVRLLLFC